ncbi:hypothetical protein HELRODRAFT_172653 [Helobdella robusta]|uniref:Antistasin-like domain-containing protein n=1 Tax=Helobdella robusta TaxID=6412 RepID=T1F5Q5_HELRO|nr:hypothetical protein HELRODRAFT_172653 [Helobdella robusta]ESO04296.1 hypothetical protein HELRODRAFT_172653 [Helobdella robusta]
MFFFVTASMVLLVNALTSESINILPICPKLPVKCLNPCELDFDGAGCQICICPVDCRVKPCPPNFECKNMCVGAGCSDYQCVPKCNPVGCENKCNSGFWIDANGCPTCRCNNVCENVQCKPDTQCVPRNATNPLAGYDCVAPMQKFCEFIKKIISERIFY